MSTMKKLPAIQESETKNSESKPKPEKKEQPSKSQKSSSSKNKRPTNFSIPKFNRSTVNQKSRRSSHHKVDYSHAPEHNKHYKKFKKEKSKNSKLFLKIFSKLVLFQLRLRHSNQRANTKTTNRVQQRFTRYCCMHAKCVRCLKI